MTIRHPKKPTRESLSPRTDSFSEWYKDSIPDVTREQARAAASHVIDHAANDTEARTIIDALGIRGLAR